MNKLYYFDHYAIIERTDSFFIKFRQSGSEMKSPFAQKKFALGFATINLVYLFVQFTNQFKI